jgi:hypothetical protein
MLLFLLSWKVFACPWNFIILVIGFVNGATGFEMFPSRENMAITSCRPSRRTLTRRQVLRSSSIGNGITFTYPNATVIRDFFLFIPFSSSPFSGSSRKQRRSTEEEQRKNLVLPFSQSKWGLDDLTNYLN